MLRPDGSNPQYTFRDLVADAVGLLEAFSKCGREEQLGQIAENEGR